MSGDPMGQGLGKPGQGLGSLLMKRAPVKNANGTCTSYMTFQMQSHEGLNHALQMM